MQVTVELEGKEKQINFPGNTIKELMDEMKLILDEYVPVLNGSVVTELEEISDGDKIKFVRVWSGG